MLLSPFWKKPTIPINPRSTAPEMRQASSGMKEPRTEESPAESVKTIVLTAQIISADTAGILILPALYDNAAKNASVDIARIRSISSVISVTPCYS